jgi:uncharacterized protein (UPF0332 family)
VTGEGRRSASTEELGLADEELRAADQLLATGLPRISLTRVYFACFHAVRALLYADQLEPRTHQGTLHLFNLHFVRAGRFTPADGRLLARLQKYREEADYGESFVVDEEGAREEITAARAFVDRLRTEVSAVLGRERG